MNYFETEAERIRRVLDKNKNLIQEKESQIENLRYEKNLLIKDSVNTLKDFRDPLSYIDFFEIWRSFDNQTGKFQGEDSKAAKQKLKMIEESFFFGVKKSKNLKFTKIIAYGFYNEAYQLHYSIGDLKFMIKIPQYDKANTENYNDLSYKLYKEDQLGSEKVDSYSLIFETFSVEELKAKINDFVKEYGYSVYQEE